MAPSNYRVGRSKRKPLVPSSPAPLDPSQLVLNMREIFDNSQHPGSTEAALEDLKKMYKNTGTNLFQPPFLDCLRKLFQSEHTHYFKTACVFVCKFLKFVSEESKTKNENSSPTKNIRPPKKTRKQSKKTQKRFKADDGSESEDELVAGLFKKTSLDEEGSESSSSSRPEAKITEHDQLLSSVMDVAATYGKVINENFRRNSTHFICLFLFRIETIDEDICLFIKNRLYYSMRDKKSTVRALAALGLRRFQGEKKIQEAFRYHFERDPELTVRRALLQVMDINVFGYEFLVMSTRDPNEIMRKSAYQRLNEIEKPEDLNSEHLHCIIHNGLNERDPQVAHKFQTQTLWPLLSKLYDGLDLHKMLEPFDVVKHADDMNCLLARIYDRDLQDTQGNVTSSKLHHVVESFRERWLSHDATCLPTVEKVDERLVTVWFSMVRFCKANQPYIQNVKIRTVRHEEGSADESIEDILESQENRDESIDLYERLSPDLVNLVEFLKNYISFVEAQLNQEEIEPEKAEFIYSQIMDFITTHEVGDELERKTVREVFDTILRESLLVPYFDNFISPIIKCLYKLVYSKSSNLMVTYLSEFVQDIRSHLEDQCEPGEKKTDERSPIFKNHPNELTKCLQMYLGCLQNVRVSEVPATMLSHLKHLSYESLETTNMKIRCLMVACNGVTALVDKNFMQTDQACMELLIASCYDESSLGIQTTGFKCLVDVVCQHDEIEYPQQGEKFLTESLKKYRALRDPIEFKREKLEFTTAVIEGTAKLFYLQKIKSPELLSYLIIWWYHPQTPSKLKQFIGIFLPVFVNDLMKEPHIAEAPWFRELLTDTFVISLENLHDYALGHIHFIAANDILNLINFLSNLLPVSLHPGIAEKIDTRMSELDEDDEDLLKYLEKSKNSLTLPKSKPDQADSTKDPEENDQEEDVEVVMHAEPPEAAAER